MLVSRPESYAEHLTKKVCRVCHLARSMAEKEDVDFDFDDKLITGFSLFSFLLHA